VLSDESDVLSEEASEPEPAVVPAKLEAIAGPAAASSAKDNETERNFMRFPTVGGSAPRGAQTNRFQRQGDCRSCDSSPARSSEWEAVSLSTDAPGK
jgi:hypothetical protein